MFPLPWSLKDSNCTRKMQRLSSEKLWPNSGKRGVKPRSRNLASRQPWQERGGIRHGCRPPPVSGHTLPGCAVVSRSGWCAWPTVGIGASRSVLERPATGPEGIVVPAGRGAARHPGRLAPPRRRPSDGCELVAMAAQVPGAETVQLGWCCRCRRRPRPVRRLGRPWIRGRRRCRRRRCRRRRRLPSSPVRWGWWRWRRSGDCRSG